MVSLRRRKLLGLCAGRSSFLTPLPRSVEPGTSPACPAHNVRSVAVHPLSSNGISQSEEKPVAKAGSGSPNVSASGSSKEVHPEPFPEPPIKRRKRHRRKHVHNQEPCPMRGVYFKNMKWQAAIKVDKKQIHLGTVGSQVEAARLYDRAAFMCGREPNFELSDVEKRELRQFKWEEFLAITRRAINNKKSKRRIGPPTTKNSDPNPQSENGNDNQETNSFSSSEEMEQDSSAS